MNKAKLIEQLAKVTRQPKTVCRDFLEAFIETVGKSLRGDDAVVLTGFGTFKVMKRKSRVGVNPATGKKMTIPARKVPKFSPGKALKELVG